MNEPKKLTKRQENIVSRHGYNPDNYCFLDETELHYIFMRKDSGQKLWIKKGESV